MGGMFRLGGDKIGRGFWLVYGVLLPSFLVLGLGAAKALLCSRSAVFRGFLLPRYMSVLYGNRSGPRLESGW